MTTVSGSTLSYNDTSAVNGQTYYYVVSAINNIGESSNSNQASGTPSNSNSETSTSLPTSSSTTATSPSQPGIELFVIAVILLGLVSASIVVLRKKRLQKK